MKLRITDRKAEAAPSTAISYNIHVLAEAFESVGSLYRGGLYEEIAVVAVSVDNPTRLNIRVTNKQALTANVWVRVQEMIERQGADLETG